MLRAFLPLDGEMVLTCADCGEASTGSLGGADGWTLRQVSAQRLVDVCARCSPRATSVAAAPVLQGCVPGVRPAVGSGLAIGPGRHLSRRRP